jgi:hypothetical protein
VSSGWWQVNQIVRRLRLLLLFPVLSSFAAAQATPKVVDVFVALADNAHQGIVPDPAALGKGHYADRNLYCGAAYGVKTFFQKSADWEQLGLTQHPSNYIIESRIFRHKASGTYLIADAYRGSEIKRAVSDFFSAAAGLEATLQFDGPKEGPIHLNKKADLAVYVGHDGLMDFSLEKTFSGDKDSKRQVIILACASKQYFGAALRPTRAEPLLWTTNLMAPEAYTLKAALDGWIADESGGQIRQRAASAYAHYQKISQNSAARLFLTGW